MAVQIRRLHSTRVHLTNPSVLRLSLRNCGRQILRLISKGTVNGILRPLINGEFTFVFGTLDQGYWPDGIYTPPNREAMVYDLHFLKSLGFNMLRKHVSIHHIGAFIAYRVPQIKVEPALFYRACDEIGLLVVQDMPSPRPLQSRKLSNCNYQTILPDAAQQEEFNRQLELLVKQHRSYPSIFSWVYTSKHHPFILH